MDDREPDLKQRIKASTDSVEIERLERCLRVLQTDRLKKEQKAIERTQKRKK